MTGLRELAQGAKTIFIAGHLRPDGDCVGAAVASYRYLKKLYPDAAIHAYVEKVPEVFDFLDSGSHDICAGAAEGAGGSVPGAGQQFEGSSGRGAGGV